MDFYVLGAHGPPYNISFMDPPFIPFQLVSRLIMGPYVMCPLCRLSTSCLAKWHPQVPPAPFWIPSWLPSWESRALDPFPIFLLIPRPCPGPRPKIRPIGLAGGYQS